MQRVTTILTFSLGISHRSPMQRIAFTAIVITLALWLCLDLV